jgi:hypothetical protein
LLSIRGCVGDEDIRWQSLDRGGQIRARLLELPHLAHGV